MQKNKIGPGKHLSFHVASTKLVLELIPCSEVIPSDTNELQKCGNDI
jgi:hypothetical protein